ncbi:MAG: PEP-CTERM sorting domain-containing protein [Candidatus Thiodiazotropha sp.]
MSKKATLSILAPLALLCAMSTSQAALIDRGAGLIYDDVLDVTWLQDASYVQNYYNSDSRAVDWQTAMSWVDGLQYEDTERGVIWDDWRLPTIDPSANYGWEPIFDPATETGSYYVYDRSESGANELAYMYYVNLGLQAYTDPITDPHLVPQPTSPDGTYNPFQNIYYLGTWTDTLTGNPDLQNQVYYFHFHFGQTMIDNRGTDTQTVWAVRDGDVLLAGGDNGTTSVPEPGMLLLLASGLLLTGGARRLKNRG